MARWQCNRPASSAAGHDLSQIHAELRLARKMAAFGVTDLPAGMLAQKSSTGEHTAPSRHGWGLANYSGFCRVSRLPAGGMLQAGSGCGFRTTCAEASAARPTSLKAAFRARHADRELRY